MPHLHISAQHGDDLILRRMKRRILAVISHGFVTKPAAAAGCGIWR